MQQSNTKTEWTEPALANANTQQSTLNISEHSRQQHFTSHSDMHAFCVCFYALSVEVLLYRLSAITPSASRHFQINQQYPLSSILPLSLGLGIDQVFLEPNESRERDRET
ncbi:hypothetical protein BLNAU_17254 [Blattamonas nauphoetae]|uniref:Uncharacterized protein n=1 Tax=Blattamonas nauphoetae TaxID=2049346 RepID=A0ABQ9X8X3_9EUKA|nr:hypothetical protein BLNAU_17254 [Blattamonas nauphoetae]